jgi:hypothetical protein
LVGIAVIPFREHFRVTLLKPSEEKENLILRRFLGIAARHK